LLLPLVSVPGDNDAKAQPTVPELPHESTYSLSP
jgi:hypothetical protein